MNFKAGDRIQSRWYTEKDIVIVVCVFKTHIVVDFGDDEILACSPTDFVKVEEQS